MGFESRDFISYTSSPTAADRDGVCAAQTTAGAGDLVIAGALAAGGIATFGEQQRVTLYSAANLSGLTFTVYGATAFGDSISEAIAGPNAGTVTTTANFKTVTRVATDGAVGTNVEVGNSAALETKWIGLDWHRALKGISVELSTGASLTYEVQYGARKRANSSDPETSILALADGTLTAKTVNAGLVASIPYPLIRLKITSFVSGTATLRVVESPA
jgi:hypothetical protein